MYETQDVKEINQFSVGQAMWNASRYAAEVMREKFLNASLSATSYLNAYLCVHMLCRVESWNINLTLLGNEILFYHCPLFRNVTAFSLFSCSIPACFQPPLLLASPTTPSQCHLLPAICGLPMHRLVTPRRIFHLLKSHHLIRHKECGREEILAIEIIVNILYLYFTVGGSRRIETEDNCKYD